MTMTKTYHREFNITGDVYLDDKQKKYNTITLAELHFRVTDLEHNLKLHHPQVLLMYDGGFKPIKWPNFKEYLEDVQIRQIAVHQESGRYFIDFYQNCDITAKIKCKDIEGLP